MGDEGSSGVVTEFECGVGRYGRGWPTVFTRAAGSSVYDADGAEYVDFFAGAGALNYGHNNPALRAALVEYLTGAGSGAHQEFVATFTDTILRPRDLNYQVRCTGPTGADAVDAAVRLARRATGRRSVVSFSNACYDRSRAVDPRESIRLPFGAEGTQWELWQLADVLDNGTPDAPGRPAAVVVETTQGDGGVITADPAWLRGVRELCRLTDVLFVVDDTQMGCGRTGPFFSFDRAGEPPDLVCLAKSISGFGLPLALTLIRPDLAAGRLGRRDGTVRGNDFALVTATRSLRLYWSDDAFERRTVEHGRGLSAGLTDIAARHDCVRAVRRRGLVGGVTFPDARMAKKVRATAFHRGLLVETAGPRGEVVTLLPPLTTTSEQLDRGLEMLDDAIDAVA